jgi:tRNA (guanine10-N2)-methyltransferase
MEKTSEEEYPTPVFLGRRARDEIVQHLPAHQGFRDKFFAGFRKPDEEKVGVNPSPQRR